MTPPRSWPGWWDEQMTKAIEHAAAPPPVPFSQALCEWLRDNRDEIEQAAARVAAEAADPRLSKPVNWSDILTYYAKAMSVPDPMPAAPDLFPVPQVDLDLAFLQAKIEVSSQSLADAIERDQERAAARRFAQAWDTVMFDSGRNPFIAIGVA